MLYLAGPLPLDSRTDLRSNAYKLPPVTAPPT
jgi:hypothetical protein